MGGGHRDPEAVDLGTAERTDRRQEWRRGLAAPGSCAVLGATWPGPSTQAAQEPGRGHSPWGTGARAVAGSDSTAPAQPAGPGSPSAEPGCVSPGTRAAGGEIRGPGKGVKQHRGLVWPLSHQGSRCKGKTLLPSECSGRSPLANLWPGPCCHPQVLQPAPRKGQTGPALCRSPKPALLVTGDLSPSLLNGVSPNHPILLG